MRLATSHAWDQEEDPHDSHGAIAGDRGGRRSALGCLCVLRCQFAHYDLDPSEGVNHDHAAAHESLVHHGTGEGEYDHDGAGKDEHGQVARGHDATGRYEDACGAIGVDSTSLDFTSLG